MFMNFKGWIIEVEIAFHFVNISMFQNNHVVCLNSKGKNSTKRVSVSVCISVIQHLLHYLECYLLLLFFLIIFL